MGGNFELLEHPSDVGILARGPSMEDALVQASKALTSLMVNPLGLQALEQRTFQAAGFDAASQVVNWLNEILFFFDAEQMAFADFVIDAWNAQGISGRALGEYLDLQRHEIRTAVKAVTYHQFGLENKSGVWELRVFVDV